MKKDFSTDLQDFLEKHSQQNGLDLTFECKKHLNDYHIKIIDADGDSEDKEIDQRTILDFVQNHSQSSKKEIIDIIFNPGPRITNSPGN